MGDKVFYIMGDNYVVEEVSSFETTIVDVARKDGVVNCDWPQKYGPDGNKIYSGYRLSSLGGDGRPLLFFCPSENLPRPQFHLRTGDKINFASKGMVAVDVEFRGRPSEGCFASASFMVQLHQDRMQFRDIPAGAALNAGIAQGDTLLFDTDYDRNVVPGTLRHQPRAQVDCFKICRVNFYKYDRRGYVIVNALDELDTYFLPRSNFNPGKKNDLVNGQKVTLISSRGIIALKIRTFSE